MVSYRMFNAGPFTFTQNFPMALAFCVGLFATSAHAVVGTLELSEVERAAIQSHTVVVLNTENAGSHSRCTGTLIGPNKVLTAAHCISKDLQNLFIVPSQYEYAVMERRSVTVPPVMHPDYHSFDIPKVNTPNFDVAIITFEGTLPANYRPTTWVPSALELGDRYWLYVAGYGISREDAGDSGELRFSRVTVENANYYRQQSFFVGNQRDGFGICKGDSGGPVFIKLQDQFVVIGIVSAITGGCQGTSYFNQTSFYNEWISAND